ncbi:MAG: phosphoglycolate phosphatase [Thiomargarita sp.]|nr:phosphoglycolate phosphatase [Thiomargarita sp.]
MDKHIRTVLFDLDGTLLDTAPDLAYAVNSVLIEQKRKPQPYAEIRPWVSHGGLVLIKRAFNLTDDDPKLIYLRQRFLDIYANNIANKTRLFESMDKVLNSLEQQQIKWGIVTNKPARLTEPLLKQVNLAERSACCISGDTLPQRKPDPAPLLHACQLITSTPNQCIYVGDASRDIEAGNRAGMRTVAALYGYIGDHEKPEQWGATIMIKNPIDLLAWIEKVNNKFA